MCAVLGTCTLPRSPHPAGSPALTASTWPETLLARSLQKNSVASTMSSAVTIRLSGTRSIQALELVRARPGITIRELADSMGIKANYLYRVMPTLEQEGKVKRRDGGWQPA